MSNVDDGRCMLELSCEFVVDTCWRGCVRSVDRNTWLTNAVGPIGNL